VDPVRNGFSILKKPYIQVSMLSSGSEHLINIFIGLTSTFFALKIKMSVMVWMIDIAISIFIKVTCRTVDRIIHSSSSFKKYIVNSEDPEISQGKGCSRKRGASPKIAKHARISGLKS
jgi:hypothetical protein